MSPTKDDSEMNNLLVESPQDSSMMDIGKNCAKCRKLDFLPVVCQFCKLTFCSDHYKLEHHNCVGLSDSFKRTVTLKYDQTAASLFPDREKDKKKIDQLIAKPPKPTSIIEKSFKVGDAAKGHKNAFSKFAKFLNLQQQKKNTGIKKLFGGAKTASPAVEMVTLKKTAKGDNKIGASDRIHVWCLFIDASEDEEDKLKNIDVDKQKTPIFFSKQWPVGRALDLISDQLRIKNNNNKTSDASERLNIFRLNDGKPTVVKPSDRCTTIKTGEILYLVKGTL